MEDIKLANLAKYVSKKADGEVRRPLKASLSALIKEFGIKNGSFKVYVRDGKPTESIDIQKQIRHKLDK